MWHESHDLAIAYRVHSFEVPTWMLWVHRPHEEELPDSTWSWRLEALQTGGTRLVTRMKQVFRWDALRLASFNLVLMGVGELADRPAFDDRRQNWRQNGGPLGRHPPLTSAPDGLRSRDLRLDRAMRTTGLLHRRRYVIARRHRNAFRVPPTGFEPVLPP
jgi:hypothetical protein